VTQSWTAGLTVTAESRTCKSKSSFRLARFKFELQSPHALLSDSQCLLGSKFSGVFSSSFLAKRIFKKVLVVMTLSAPLSTSGGQTWLNSYFSDSSVLRGYNSYLLFVCPGPVARARAI
jgi:hypothetical protein